MESINSQSDKLRTVLKQCDYDRRVHYPDTYQAFKEVGGVFMRNHITGAFGGKREE